MAGDAGRGEDDQAAPRLPEGEEGDEGGLQAPHLHQARVERGVLGIPQPRPPLPILRTPISLPTPNPISLATWIEGPHCP